MVRGSTAPTCPGVRTVPIVIIGSDRAAYRQLADLLRAEITSGRIRPGELLPYETRLQQEYDVGRETVRRALAVLRTEGLVVTERGYGTRVVVEQERERVRVPRGAELLIRMPSEDERTELGIPPGAVVAVVIVMLGGRERGKYAADRVILTTA
jgi:DNA-binding transcriptional regulator YhcF (GntR family)